MPLKDGFGFLIYAVRDGERYGILVGRQRGAESAAEWGYFYPGGPYGLAPNEATIKLCKDTRHRLTNPRDIRILELLKGAAEYWSSQEVRDEL